MGARYRLLSSSPTKPKNPNLDLSPCSELEACLKINTKVMLIQEINFHFNAWWQ